MDKAKSVFRQSYLTDGSRKENDAEHMWHLALCVLVLGEYAAEPVDLVRVLKMVLIHDIVEIDAGDTYIYDDVGRATQAEREGRAADRLYGLLPADQEAELREIWEEFEARATPESRFAAAVDRLQPVLLNLATEGRAWREHRMGADRVLAVNSKMEAGAPDLWDYVRQLLDDAVARGWLDEKTS
ncbi:MAG: HD domain-containing protein [Actinobacteria bacterium]|nr:HD domain-containing protein [Actinomycetota bacterium]MBW3650972.1 HD domain-containing protein [Actinomycetota bacterium]